MGADQTGAETRQVHGGRAHLHGFDAGQRFEEGLVGGKRELADGLVAGGDDGGSNVSSFVRKLNAKAIRGGADDGSDLTAVMKVYRCAGRQLLRDGGERGGS